MKLRTRRLGNTKNYRQQKPSENSRVFTQNFGSKLTVNEDAKNTLVTFEYKGLKLTKHSNFDMFYFPGIWN